MLPSHPSFASKTAIERIKSRFFAESSLSFFCVIRIFGPMFSAPRLSARFFANFSAFSGSAYFTEISQIRVKGGQSNSSLSASKSSTILRLFAANDWYTGCFGRVVWIMKVESLPLLQHLRRKRVSTWRAFSSARKSANPSKVSLCIRATSERFSTSNHFVTT